MIEAAFAAHLAATWFMVGVVWFAQAVHYPLFRRVDRASFAMYQRGNLVRTGSLVAIPMALETLTAVLFLFVRPEGMSPYQAWAGAILLGIVGLSTAAVLGPAHLALRRAFNSRLHRRLVVGNLVRTASWSARGVLVLWIATTRVAAAA